MGDSRHEAGLTLAMIAAAALQAGCDRPWSEDMQHGMAFEEGLIVVNPFRSAE
ncbi:hypothetical protein BN1110_02815 [bacterium YEK0313]|nr:hypothetical protein BN1110_02815 [bacterium YEK0313]